MSDDTLGNTRLEDIGRPITLDTRVGGDPDAIIKGTLVGVTRYHHQERDEKHTRLEVRTFGDQVVVAEFVAGDLSRPAPDDDEPLRP